MVWGSGWAYRYLWWVGTGAYQEGVHLCELKGKAEGIEK